MAKHDEMKSVLISAEGDFICDSRFHPPKVDLFHRKTDLVEKDLNFLSKLRSFSGAPGELRTPGASVRSRVLYPAEVKAQNCFPKSAKPILAQSFSFVNNFFTVYLRYYTFLDLFVLLCYT